MKAPINNIERKMSQPAQQLGNTQIDYDIIISGYGPAGATIANFMGQKGYSVAIIDQFEGIFDKPRAITADQEVMRVFQELGLAEFINATSSPHPGTDFVGMDGEVIKRFYPAPPPQQLSWEATWMFVQPELEATLRQGVARFQSVHALLGCQVVHHEKLDDRVLVQVRNLKEKTERTIVGKYLLSCEGANSQIRLREQAAIEDLAFDEWWMVVDMWVRGPVELPERCVQYCRPSRPGTYIVGPDNLRRWEMKILPHENPQEFIQDSQKVMDALSSFVDTTHLELCRIAVYRFHAMVAQDWRFERVFLLGDSAHQMPPFLGQGLCAAIRDAANLAWKIDGVERHGYSPRVLDTYGQERKKHVRTIVEHAKNFGLIIGELDEEAARQRDRQLRELLLAGKAETVRQKFIPGLEVGALAQHSDGQLQSGAGELFVQPWVQSGKSWVRLDDVMPTGFWIVGNGDLNAQGWVDLPAWQQLKGRTAHIYCGDQALVAASDVALHLREREPLFTGWMQQKQALAVLVRPDHYVYGVARTLDELIALIHQAAADIFDYVDGDTLYSVGAKDIAVSV